MNRRFLLYLMALAFLAGAIIWGRTRGARELEPPLLRVFPEAGGFRLQEGVHHAYARDGTLLGWAATGTANGYGGPMILLVGIDTLGGVAGVEVVEHRETPIFWRMVRAPAYFEHIAGTDFREVSYDYADAVAVTGATRSSDAIVASVRAAVALVAGEAFDVRIPLPRRPFEFGLLEVVILGLFTLGVVGHRSKGPLRRRLRWAGQITGLLVLGFWKNSPITLAKITSILSGYIPDLRTGLAIYLLVAGFLLTSVFYGRNLYCLYACPFGAAQRVVGAIGGFRLKLPPWSVRFMGRARNLIVLVALFMAFLTLQPALVGYEPFAALFSMNGTTLQWLLLFIVLVASLVLVTPWCNLFCPMRTFEVVIHDGKRWWKGRGGP
ncbi:FMN-binding protein [Gemmatimonadota bacterium]